MTRWHNVYLDGHPHFCTATVADWEPLLVGEARDILYEEWESARQDLGVKVLAYVLMPEHFHNVLWSESGKKIMHFLQRTLAQTSRRLGEKGVPFWKERPRVLPLDDSNLLRVKVDYLHRNPVARKLVENPEDWEHSSYAQLEMGLLDVPFLCDDWTGIDIG